MNEHIHLRTVLLIGGAIATMFGSIGCANVSHALVYQDTTLGINGGASPQNGNINLKIGFQRNFASVVPKVKNPNPNSPDAPDVEAGSVFAASRYSVKGLQLPDIDEFIVTGDAAAELGKAPGAVETFGLNSR
jgi:hypothetical protein